MKNIHGGNKWILAVLGAFFAFLGVQIAVIFVMSFFAVLQNPSRDLLTDGLDFVMQTLAAAQIAAFLIAIIWYPLIKKPSEDLTLTFKDRIFAYKKIGKKEAFANQTLAHKACSVLVLVAIGLVLQLGISAVLSIFQWYFPDLMKEYNELMESTFSPSLLSLISVVVLAPISEEIFFRGIIMRYAQRIHPNVYFAVFIQAVLFGIAHGNMVQGTYAALLGLVLGLVCLKMGGLGASIFVHFVVNLSSYAVGFVLYFVSIYVPFGFGAVAVISLLLSIVLLKRILAYSSYELQELKNPPLPAVDAARDVNTDINGDANTDASTDANTTHSQKV